MISKLIVQVNGKELTIPVELTETQIRQIYMAAESDTKLTGWEEPKNGQLYFYEDALGRVQSVEANDATAIQLKMLYQGANCFASERIASNMARGDLLIRTLRREAILSRKNKIDFNNDGGYTITYNYQDKCLECGITGNWMALGDVVFESEEDARRVMNEYADELIWYFTQLNDSL